jgi:hypothetical protein
MAKSTEPVKPRIVGEAAAAGTDGTEFLNAATSDYRRPITILIC